MAPPIVETRRKIVNVVGNFRTIVNVVGNCQSWRRWYIRKILDKWRKLVMSGKFFNVTKNFGMSGKIFWPLKWYTDRNFFGDGGGSGGGWRRSPKKIFQVTKKFLRRPCRKLFFGLSEKYSPWPPQKHGSHGATELGSQVPILFPPLPVTIVSLRRNFIQRFSLVF
jgi:hypothetical protein